jgi:hypothetical protein
LPPSRHTIRTDEDYIEGVKISAALSILLVLCSSACHGRTPSPQASPSLGAEASAGPAPPTIPPTDAPNTNPTMDPTLTAAFSPQAEAGATAGKPVDPRTLTPSELRFGRAPKLDRSVKYQPNVLVMEHGDTAIRSMESNGIIWHFDAGAPQVDQIQAGKIVFATERCVGRVGAIRRNGDDVSVVMEPVQLTDIIQQGHFVYNQPLDLSAVVVAPVPDVPVQFKEDVVGSPSPGASPTGVPSTATTGFVTRRFRLAAVTYAIVSASGKWKPYRVATYGADGHVTQRFLQLAVDRVAQVSPGGGSMPTGIPAPPAGIGEPPRNVEIAGGMTALPCTVGCGGIGIQLKYSRNGLNVYANSVFFLRKPNVEFNVDIGLSGIKTAAIWINGAAGFTSRFEASADRAFAGNVHVLQPIPFDLTLPLNFAAPIGVHLIQNIALSSGFSARTSVLTAGITFQACCQFAVGYINGNWGANYPQISVLTPQSNVSGISVGINSLVFGLSQELLVGLGFAGFATGPYIAISESMTALKQSSTTTIDCRQATLDMQLNAGVGYTMPAAVTSIVNVFLTLANAEPLSASGSILKMQPANILHYKGSLPKDCAG